MDTSHLRGSIVPLITPFKDGELDLDTLEELIEWQVENGSHGLGVAGSTGEPDALSIEERKLLIKRTIEIADGRVPVMPGTGTNNLQETLDLTAYAEDAGADVVLVVCPYYSKPSQEGLFRHFSRVAESTKLPIIVYNIPGRAAVNMEPETLARLNDTYENIVGVKEANKDFEQVSKDMDRCGRDFLVYSGIEMLCFPLLAIGGAGYVSATGNILPGKVAQLYDLAAAGEWEKARDLHYELLPLNEVLFIETNPGPAKTALGMLGKIDPELRDPLAPPSPEHQQKIRDVLAGYGLLEG